MKPVHRILAVTAALLTATAAFAQTGANNPARRQGDVFHYGPMNSAPSQSLTNPLSGGSNPLTRDQKKPQNAVTPVPEPEQWAMMLAGLALVGFIVRRNSKRS